MSGLSIIVPCYNEEESIPLFYKAVEKVLAKMKDVQPIFWFIDDGSKDNTLPEIKELRKQDKNVHYISFSRNFGKEAAIYAGLKNVDTDYVVLMDVDLQDPPDLLPKMYQLIKSVKYDSVGCRRVDRDGESKFKSFLSDRFYSVINKISDVEIVPGVRDYRMMTKQIVQAVLEMNEYSRFSKGIFSWVGFRTKYLEYHNIERVAGKSDWTTWALFKYALTGIVDFSQTPLNMSMWIGMISFLLSIIGILFVCIRKIILPNSSVFGWASLVSIILLIGGLQLLCLGIIGKYIGKIYLQVKNRPIYLEKEKQ